MNNKIIEKYLDDRASKQEAEQVLDWGESCEEHKQTLLRLRLDHLFGHFPHTDASEQAIKHFWKRYRSRRNFMLVFSKVAAIILFPLMGLSIYQYLLYNKKTQHPTHSIALVTDNPDSIVEYIVNPGVKGRVVLPDSSEVWLNSNSSLVCPIRFGADSRVVELNGEAFFDVRNDLQRPMYVRTSKEITVKVTGTKFNISTYANDNFFNLHLVSGKVRLINENNKTELDVLPAQEVSVHVSNQRFKLNKNADERLNTAWKDGCLVFDGTLLIEVIHKMERWYGVSIEVKAPNILNETFTAEFKSESLTQVLDFLKMSSNINYLITDQKVVLSY